MPLKTLLTNIACFAFSALMLFSCKHTISEYENSGKIIEITPDYTNTVLPPNIAPINFRIREEAEKYHVEIYSDKGDKITLQQKSPEVQIPISKWHRLLSQNPGGELKMDIYTQNGKWMKHPTLVNTISSDSIDDYMVYRLIHAVYLYWHKMEIVQRNLSSFEEKHVFTNTSSEKGCVNCHSFGNNDPSKMVMHFRIKNSGSMIYQNNQLKFLDTKTPYTMSAFVYPSWHPNGNVIAFSVLKLAPFVTSMDHKYVDVADKASDLVIYNIANNTVSTSPKISTKSRENLPTWSPDGKWLYFISAPEAKDSLNSVLDVKYSLLRIGYDYENNSWGDVDTVLSAGQTGMSISWPVVSPDGKYLLFCMTDYGYFTIYHKNSDLYLLDLATMEYKKLDINSPSNESYHSWSSNGRWIVFSSKRLDDIYTRPFITYFDKEGHAHKPFPLPQSDPGLYDALLTNYNRPEFITGKIDLNQRDIRDLIYNKPEKVNFDASVELDALSGATRFSAQ
jgi:hypothetical protein